MRKEGDIFTIAKGILDYKFKQESVGIYCSKDIPKSLPYQKWEESCKDLLCTFSWREEAYSGIITFPGAKLTTLNRLEQGEMWERAMTILKTWCKSSCLNNPLGLIVRNYDLKSHLYFCGISSKDIKKILNIKVKRFKKILEFLENSERMIVFNPSQNIILVIHLVEVEKGNQLKNQVYHCINEVNLWCFLLRDSLKESGVIVTGLLVYSGEYDYSKSKCANCSNCSNFIVSHEIFNSVEIFDMFWEQFITQNCYDKLAEHLKSGDKMKTFEAIASKMVGFLSHLQFTVLEQPVLPVVENNATKNIKQAELLLDLYQMEVAYSLENFILLTGNYGTGKTTVVLKKIKLLARDLKENEVIYYINFHAKSALDCRVKQLIEKSDKIKVIKTKFHLSCVIEFEILPKEEREGTRKINLIVDEYNPQDLLEGESKKLKQIFTERELFKNAVILIVIQPIQIDRIHFYDTNGNKRESWEKKQMFGALGEIMKIYHLKNAMRTTVQINTLAEISQKYLNNKSNYYARYHEPYNPSISNPDNDLEFCPPSSKLNSSSIDHDKLHKLTSTEVIKTNHKIETKYSFNFASKIGHNISGPLPHLIKLHSSHNQCEEVALIAVILAEILKLALKRRMVILHFEPNDQLWLRDLIQLSHFESALRVTFEVEEFLMNSNSNLVLVTNYNHVNGLEFADVLLLLDANEYHLKQFIPGAIARSTENLSLIIRPSQKKNAKNETISDLVDHWVKKNHLKHVNMKTPILKISELQFCSDTFCNDRREFYCKDDTERRTILRVHKNCNFFKSLVKDIQRKILRNLKSEKEKASGEAKAL